MCVMLKAIGRGLLLVGLVLIFLYFVGISLRGSEALSNALDPHTISNYLVLLPIIPGAFLIWLAHYTGRRRHLHQIVKGQMMGRPDAPSVPNQ